MSGIKYQVASIKYQDLEEIGLILNDLRKEFYLNKAKNVSLLPSILYSSTIFLRPSAPKL